MQTTNHLSPQPRILSSDVRVHVCVGHFCSCDKIFENTYTHTNWRIHMPHTYTQRDSYTHRDTYTHTGTHARTHAHMHPERFFLVHTSRGFNPWSSSLWPVWGTALWWNNVVELLIEGLTGRREGKGNRDKICFPRDAALGPSSLHEALPAHFHHR